MASSQIKDLKDPSMMIEEETDSKIFQNGNYLPPSFKNQSYELARDIIQYSIHGKNNVSPAPSHAAQAMRDLVDDMIADRTTMLASFAKRLNISDKTQLSLLTSVAEEMFSDDYVTWARIVSLHAFCGYVAKYCHNEKFIPNSAEEITDILSNFVINRLGLWIVSQGSWKGFEKQFPNLCWTGPGLWKGIMVVGIFLGAIMSLYVFIHGTSSPEASSFPFSTLV